MEFLSVHISECIVSILAIPSTPPFTSLDLRFVSLFLRKRDPNEILLFFGAVLIEGKLTEEAEDCRSRSDPICRCKLMAKTFIRNGSIHAANLYHFKDKTSTEKLNIPDMLRVELKVFCMIRWDLFSVKFLTTSNSKASLQRFLKKVKLHVLVSKGTSKIMMKLVKQPSVELVSCNFCLLSWKRILKL